MTLLSVQDLFYVVGAICFIWITVFLCWALYQVGKLIHQMNDVVGGARHKMEQIEQLVTGVTRSVGAIALGGKEIRSFLKKRKKDKEEE